MTTLDGRILAHRDEPADIGDGPERCLDRVDELFDELRPTTRGLPGALWGIGIGVPGPVEFRTGTPVSPPIMPGWDGYPVRSRFAAAYDAPVWVDNDVNLLALGEWRSGAAVGPRQRGRHQGRHGHRRRDHLRRPAPPRRPGQCRRRRPHPGRRRASVICRCGNIGCLEALAGGAALGRDGEAAARDGRSERLRAALDQHGEVTAEDVARAASFGDPVAVALLQARRPADRPRCSPSVVNFFNPSLIVIGGGVAQSGDHLLARHPRDGLPPLAAARDPRAAHQRSSLGGLAGVIGASAMVVDQLFSRDPIARWMAAGGPAGCPMSLPRRLARGRR